MTETAMEQDAIDPLGGQVAVVTGAARGIGEAIALRLARMGAAVVLTAPARCLGKARCVGGVEVVAESRE